MDLSKQESPLKRTKTIKDRVNDVKQINHFKQATETDITIRKLMPYELNKKMVEQVISEEKGLTMTDKVVQGASFKHMMIWVDLF